jgi:hypothetical protein
MVLDTHITQFLNNMSKSTQYKTLTELLEKALIANVEKELPKFTQLVKQAKEKGSTSVMLHQDAFAFNYEQTEIELLGLAIKYSSIYGIEVIITGKNREHSNMNNAPKG